MRKSMTIFTLLLIAFLFSSCGASGPSADLAYKFVNKRGIGPGIDRYTFAYSINNGPLNNMDIYVYEEFNQYLITPEFVKGQAQTQYEYITDTPNRNFRSPLRMSTDTVNSLEEAIQKALMWYIEDFKLDAIEKEQENQSE